MSSMYNQYYNSNYRKLKEDLEKEKKKFYELEYLKLKRKARKFYECVPILGKSQLFKEIDIYELNASIHAEALLELETVKEVKPRKRGMQYKK